jgi:hypothetical protein
MTEERELQVMPEEGKEIEPYDVASSVEQAERQIAALVRKKALMLQITTKRDWIKMGDNAYLTVAGCQKVAGLFGLSWQLEVPVKHWQADGHFTWEYQGTFTLTNSGRTITETGSRSSKDDLYSKAHGKTIKPELIDEPAVKKAAYTNCLGRGISAMLGLRGFSWAEVQDAGIKTAGLEVGFKSRAPQTPQKQSPAPQKAEAPVPTPSEEKKSAPASTEAEKQDIPAPNGTEPLTREEMAAELDEILTRLSEGDEQIYGNLLEGLSAFKDVRGKRKIEDLTPGRLRVTLAKAKKEDK